MAPTPFRWGILSTGAIASHFSKDLLINPATRNVHDVSHSIHAVASRSVAKANEFIDTVWEEAGADQTIKAKAYGTYEELYQDSEVDAIYIATPHSHHYKNAFDALSAGKNVLCEKSLVVNGDQAQALVDLAREKNVFFMEGVWVRFQPIAYKVQEILQSGLIGEIRSVQAELFYDFEEPKKQENNRLFTPALAGGALLDLGPYPWTWIALTLLTPNLPISSSPLPVPSLIASISKTKSGVDAHTVAVLKLPQPGEREVQATWGCSVRDMEDNDRCVVVNGSKGVLVLQSPASRPTSLSYTAWETEEARIANGPSQSEKIDFSKRPGNAWGFIWEADEVARCIQAGKKESERMPLNQTVLMMRVFDEIRRQGDLVYPESIETLKV